MIAGKSARGADAEREPAQARPRPPTDALSLLEADHVAVRDLLAMLARMAPGRNRERTTRVLAEDLWIVLQIEEEILYPALPPMGTVLSRAPLVRPALKETLAELEACPSDSAEVPALAARLIELHELDRDDEERNVFPHARRVLRASELATLGERMLRRRQALRESGEASRPSSAIR
jgi:hypothetical protein